MAELTQIQNIAWVINKNLTDEIANPNNSLGDVANYRELLQGFLRNEQFEMALLGAAEEYDPSQLPAITRNVSTAYQSPETMIGAQAEHLVDAIAQGDLSSLTTLIDGYDPANGHAAQIDAIELNDFGVVAFDDAVEDIDSDAYYHVVADPRYAEIQQRYTELTGTRIDIDADIAEAQQFVTDYPDPELAAEAEAFYSAYLASPDAYMSEAPSNIIDEGISAPITPEIINAPPNLSAESEAPSMPQAPEAMPIPAAVELAANIDEAPAVAEDTTSTTDFVWDDNVISSTYDALRTANPETISSMSDVTQEAFSVVQNAVGIETELAQYNAAPYAYKGVPPTLNSLETAENTAYDYLVALSPADGETVTTEATAVVGFDAEQGITPPTPSQQGGQEYLADAGLNETGTATLASEAAAAFAKAATTEETILNQTVVSERSFTWGDDQILSTYEDLHQANPETIAGTSAATQKAYSYVAEAIAIETEIAQYNVNPSTYIANGNIPPTENTLMAAEDAAYEHLASLDTETAETVSTEAAEVVVSDAENNITPLTPAQEGGQQYLADAGLNKDGTAYVEEETFQAPAADNDPSPQTITEPFAGVSAKGPATPEVDSVHNVVGGDNLWNIAKDHYGLEGAADIMRAVDHIARANKLENGTDANHINVGDKLDMPSAEQVTQDVDTLDWSALDAETKANLRGSAPAMDERAAAAPSM